MMDGSSRATGTSPQPRKLVILCLHGFRQNARQFKGRLAGLQRKLADVATLHFIDAPHVLPLWYKPTPEELAQQQQDQQQDQQQEQQQERQHSAEQQDDQQQPPQPGVDTTQRNDPSPPAAPQPHTQQQQQQQQKQQQQQQQQKQQQQQQQQQHHMQRPPRLPAPKRAWLLSPELLAAQAQLQAMLQQHQQQQQQQQQETQQGQPEQQPQQPAPAPVVWQVAPADVATAGQHLSQASGWKESWRVIQDVLCSGQQIDGLLGFSQGAAVAAVVAALLQQQGQLQKQQQQQDGSHQQQQQQQQDGSHQQQQTLKFVIIASGFISPAAEHQQLLEQQWPLHIPSLHVYAAADMGSDRQIQQQLSDALLEVFDPATRRQLVHQGGHLIPCNKAVVSEIKAFLHSVVAGT